MKRLSAIFVAFFCLSFVPTHAAAQEDPAGENTVLDGLREKGVDWLKDKAKDAGKEWVFDTGQSETMHAILQAAEERANGAGNDTAGRCQGAVMGKASSILNDINTIWTVRTAARLEFDTLTNLASLAAGGLGAAAEGNALNWLVEQYVDAAKGQASESAFDRIKRAFVGEEKPEFELYETTGTNGPCDYTLRAAWDIVRGSYRVYIAGDCHCQQVGNVGVSPRPLGKWWIAFEGHVTLRVDAGNHSSTWVVGRANMVDFDAQCACSSRPLRTAFAQPVNPPATATTPTPSTTPSNPGPSSTGTTPPPGPISNAIPPAGRHVCQECSDIQKRIDDDHAALDTVSENLRDDAPGLEFANAHLESDQGKLEDFHRNPAGYDITEAAIRQQIVNDQATVDRIKQRIHDEQAERSRLENELRDLGLRLEDCIKTHCPPEHASVGSALKDVLGHVSIGIGVGPRDRHGDKEHGQDKERKNDKPRETQPTNGDQPSEDH